MCRRACFPLGLFLLGLLSLAVIALAGCGGGSEASPTAAEPSAAQADDTTTEVLPPATTTAPASAPFRAVLTVSTQTPTAETIWPYRLDVTDGDGRPLEAAISVAVVDPLQQAHPVELGRTTTKLTDWPIDGTFADDVIWPAESRNVPLTFRIVVDAAGGTATLTVPLRVR